MNTEAFPCASRYTEGKEKIRDAVSHHGIMQANRLRNPARQAETSAAIKQIARQVRPTLKGQVKAQNLAFAPSGVRKYPYVRPECGTSIVKACLCHNQTKRMATTAARKGRSVVVQRNTTRLSQTAETASTTHHPTRTKGHVSLPYRSPMTMVIGVAQSPTTKGRMVESATCIVAGFSGTGIVCDNCELRQLSLAPRGRFPQWLMRTNRRSNPR